ncbi:MAG: DNA-binding protein WhiA [Erysipelotrichaceae bacterium]|nr:DNA-binding protein WhiA [Erysipelotrichaceae bacterium]
MSFSTEIKQEIAYNSLKDCCKKAELASVLVLSAKFIDNDLILKSENPTSVRRVVQLVKDLYATETRLNVYKKNNLDKSNVYELVIFDKAKEILEDLKIYKNGINKKPLYSLTVKDCCARAYIAGSFLSSGTCNAPGSHFYNLDISCKDEHTADFLLKLMNRFDLDPKKTLRRNKSVVYLKKAEKISDFLRCVGAHESLMNFENARINKDFKHSLIRITNCEVANEIKALNASKTQLEDIAILIDSDRYDDLDPKLKEVADLRIKFQEYSLNELCEQYYLESGNTISKSGMKHRFNKINELARIAYDQQ